MIKVAVVITDGSEELEAVTIVDILRRSKFLKVDLVVLSPSLQIECNRHVKIIGDVLFKDFNWEGIEAIVLPGGMRGARTFETSEVLQKILQSLWSKGKIVAAICASVVALKAARIGKGAPATSHPCVKSELDEFYNYDDSSAVLEFRDPQCNSLLITSRGPGTALAFALALLSHLVGASEAYEVAKPLMIPQ